MGDKRKRVLRMLGLKGLGVFGDRVQSLQQGLGCIGELRGFWFLGRFRA